MKNKERFLNTLSFKKVDRLPLYFVGIWPDTMERWHKEGLPQDVTDVHSYLGLDFLKVTGLSGAAGLFPSFLRRRSSGKQRMKLFQSILMEEP